MQIHTTDTPAKLLGEELSNRINAHDGDVVCLLSGGSALDVVQYINLEGHRPLTETQQVLAQGIIAANPSLQSVGGALKENNRNKPECRTIFMMGDERWSREQTTNNTLQLQARYPDHEVNQSLIETVPGENESLEDFASRIEKTFLEKISQLKNVKIFMILGMGSDGHTAGIFPQPKELFQRTYRDDLTYVPVHVEGLTIDSRASFTPSWILDHVDEIFACVTGDSKRMMLESLINETKELHERPAEILKRHRCAHLYTDQFLEPK